MKTRTSAAMRLLLCVTTLALGITSPVLNAQSTIEQEKTIAVRLYPELGVKGSPLNQRYVTEYNRLKTENPTFFDDESWPLLLAKQCADYLSKNSAPVSAVPKQRHQLTYEEVLNQWDRSRAFGDPRSLPDFSRDMVTRMQMGQEANDFSEGLTDNPWKRFYARCEQTFGDVTSIFFTAIVLLLTFGILILGFCEGAVTIAKPPKTSSPLITQHKGEDTDAFSKDIKRAWIAAVVSGSVTMVFALIAIGGTELVPGVNGWALSDVAILFGLAFGIYKRSRTCAVLITVYAIFNEIYLLSAGTLHTGLQLVFIYFYVRAIFATFAYQRLHNANISQAKTQEAG